MGALPRLRWVDGEWQEIAPLSTSDGARAGENRAAPGLLEPGNIDLAKRPVVHNADGSISTVASASFNLDGKETLIPMVKDDGSGVFDDTDEGRSGAIDQYRKTGKHLGIFDTPDNATTYAKQLHQAQAAYYDKSTPASPTAAPRLRLQFDESKGDWIPMAPDRLPNSEPKRLRWTGNEWVPAEPNTVPPTAAPRLRLQFDESKGDWIPMAPDRLPNSEPKRLRWTGNEWVPAEPNTVPAAGAIDPEEAKKHPMGIGESLQANFVQQTGEKLGDGGVVDTAGQVLNRYNPVTPWVDRVKNAEAFNFGNETTGWSNIQKLSDSALLGTLYDYTGGTSLTIGGGGERANDPDRIYREFQKNPNDATRLAAQKLLYQSAQQRAAAIAESQRDLSTRGQTFAGEVVSGVESMVPYMMQIGLGAIGGPLAYIAPEAMARYAELRNDTGKLDENGHLVMTKEGTGALEAAGKAGVGAALSYFIETELEKATKPIERTVGRAGKWIGKQVGIEGAAETGARLLREKAGQVLPSQIRDAAVGFGKTAGRVLENRPRLAASINVFNRAVGFNDMATEVAEEYADQMSDAYLNLSNNYEKWGKQNLGQAQTQFDQQLPSLVASLYLMKGLQYGVSLPITRAQRERHNRALSTLADVTDEGGNPTMPEGARQLIRDVPDLGTDMLLLRAAGRDIERDANGAPVVDEDGNPKQTGVYPHSLASYLAANLNQHKLIKKALNALGAGSSEVDAMSPSQRADLLYTTFTDAVPKAEAEKWRAQQDDAVMRVLRPMLSPKETDPNAARDLISGKTLDSEPTTPPSVQAPAPPDATTAARSAASVEPAPSHNIPVNTEDARHGDRALQEPEDFAGMDAEELRGELDKRGIAYDEKKQNRRKYLRGLLEQNASPANASPTTVQAGSQTEGGDAHGEEIRQEAPLLTSGEDGAAPGQDSQPLPPVPATEQSASSAPAQAAPTGENTDEHGLTRTNTDGENIPLNAPSKGDLNAQAPVMAVRESTARYNKLLTRRYQNAIAKAESLPEGSVERQQAETDAGAIRQTLSARGLDAEGIRLLEEAARGNAEMIARDKGRGVLKEAADGEGTDPVFRSAEPSRKTGSVPGDARKTRSVPEAQRFEAVTPRGDVRVKGRWKVVSVDDLVTSDKPEFDQELQPRDRSTAEAREQVASIAAKPDATRLLDGPTTDVGAPLVDARGHVISGNGRTMGVRQAYEGGKAGQYKREISKRARALGLSTEGVRRPMLVREIADTGGARMVDIAELSNRKQALERSEAETAEADAKALSKPGVMALFEPDQSGDVRAASNHEFLKAFAHAAGVEGMRTADGGFSPGITQRVRRAVLAAIFQKSETARKTIADAIENADALGVKRVLDGIMVAGGKLLKLADAKPELDITPELGQALSEYIAFRKEVNAGTVKTIEQYLGQRDMFADERSAPVTTLLREFEARKSMKAVRALLDRYIELAQNVDTGTASLFGDEVSETNPEELLELARHEKSNEPAQTELPGMAEGERGKAPESEAAVARKSSDGDSGRGRDDGNDRNDVAAAGKNIPLNPPSKGDLDQSGEAFSATRSALEKKAYRYTGDGQAQTRVTEEMLRAVFPTAKIKKNGEDWEVTTRNGRKLLVRTVNDIPLTPERIEKIKKAYPTIFGSMTAAQINGMYVPMEIVDSVGAKIELADLMLLSAGIGENDEIIRHEALHWADELGLFTPEERAGLLARAREASDREILERLSTMREKSGYTREQTLAFYRSLSDSEVLAHFMQKSRGFWRRVSNFLKKVWAGLMGDSLRLAGFRAEDVFRSGDIWDRTPGRVLRGESRFAVNPGVGKFVEEGLDAEVRPVAITGRAFGRSVRTARILARRWLRDNVKGTYRNQDTGWDIGVAKLGIEHATSGTLSAESLEVLRELPQLLKNAVLITSRPSRKTNSLIKSVSRFVAAAELEGKQYRIKLTIRETKEGHRFYDHGATEIEMPAASVRGSDVNLNAPGRPTGTMSIRDLFPGVKSVADVVAAVDPEKGREEQGPSRTDTDGDNIPVSGSARPNLADLTKELMDYEKRTGREAPEYMYDALRAAENASLATQFDTIHNTIDKLLMGLSANEIRLPGQAPRSLAAYILDIVYNLRRPSRVGTEAYFAAKYTKDAALRPEEASHKIQRIVIERWAREHHYDLHSVLNPNISGLSSKLIETVKASARHYGDAVAYAMAKMFAEGMDEFATEGDIPLNPPSKGDLDVGEQFSITLPAEMKARVDEARSAVADWFGERHKVWGWLTEAREKRPQGTKPDLGFVDPLIGTMAWYSQKIPALHKMYQAAVRHADVRHALSDMIFGDVEGGANDASAWVLDFGKRYQEGKKALDEYLFARDRDALGYQVKEVGKDVYAVFDLPDAKGERKELHRENDEDAAWHWAYNREAEIYGRSVAGIKGAAQGAAAEKALLGHRLINHRKHAMLKARAEALKADYEKMGGTMPEVVLIPYADGKTEERDLWQALREMGDRRGYYMPRLRGAGRYVLIAQREMPTAKGQSSNSASGGEGQSKTRGIGDSPRTQRIRKHFDTEAARDAYHMKLRKEGWDTADIQYAISDRPSEDAFLEGSIAAMNELTQKAIDTANRAARDEVTFESMGAKASRQIYKRKDGKTELHLVIEAPDTPQMTKVMMELGGQRYDDKQTGTGRAWHWVGRESNLNSLQERILSRLTEQQVTEHQLDMVRQSLFSNLAAVLHSRGSRQSKIGRSDAVGDDVWQGYETDAERATIQQAYAIAGGSAKGIMAKAMLDAMMGKDVSWDEYKFKNLPEDWDTLDEEERGDEMQALWKKYNAEVKEKRIDSAKQPKAFKVGMEFMRNMLRNETSGERMFAMIKGATAAYFLSRLSSAAVNLTALPTVVVPAMQAFGGVSMKRAVPLLIKAIGKYTQYWMEQKGMKTSGKWTITKEERELFAEIRRRRWDDSQYRADTVGALQHIIGRGWNSALNTALTLFSVTESLNRASTIAATYWGIKENVLRERAAAASGKGQSSNFAKTREIGDSPLEWTKEDHEDALARAHDVSEKAHGNYTKANLPSWAQGDSPGALVMKSAYLFRNYTHNYLQLLPATFRKDKQAAAWMLASSMIMGGTRTGAGGLLAYGIIEGVGEVFRAIGVPVPDDIFGSFFEWLEKLGWIPGRLARTGLVGLAGVDIRGSTEIRFGVPTSLWELTGAAGGVVERIGQGVSTLAKGDPLFAAEKALPPALAGIPKAIREHSRGVTNSDGKALYDAQGAPIRPGVYAALLTVLGFNPASVSEQKEKQYSANQIKSDYAKLRSGVYDRVKAYLSTNHVPANAGYLADVAAYDPETWAGIMVDVERFNERVKRQGYTQSEVPLITKDSIKGVVKDFLRPPKVSAATERALPVLN